MVVSVSAGSNVSGILTDVTKIAKITKNYGGYMLFDFAAVAPYVPIDLSQKDENGNCLIDGIFISPHKFLGGPGTPGVLIMNRKLYNNKERPTHGGGGTVDFVNKEEEIYTESIMARENSGTPGVIQIIKCGLVFDLKRMMMKTIEKREHYYMQRFLNEYPKE